MQALSINLDIQCEVCENKEYLEHESGFYVCHTCGTISQVRYGMGLDFTDINKGTMVIRKKIVNSEDIEEYHDEHMIHTMVHTCANSEFGDSNSTRKSRGKKFITQIKPLNEILLEYQKIFFNLLNFLGKFQLEKKNKLTGYNLDNVHSQESEYFNQVLSFGKVRWMEYIRAEYKIQSKGTRPKSRSRRNTEDPNIQNTSGNKKKSTYANSKYTYKKRKKSIRDQLKERKVKEHNITLIEDYSKKLRHQDKIHLFIEEYDQVKNNLLNYQQILKENDIDPKESLSFKNLIKIANIFNVPNEDKTSFEELIHLIFSHSGLNLISLYKDFKNYDESKSTLTPDYFLAIFYTIFNESKLTYNSKYSFPGLMFRDILKIHGSFLLNNLNNEIKFLKYLNKEKLLKLIHSDLNRLIKTESQQNNSNYVDAMLNYICQGYLKLPPFFAKCSFEIYKICAKSIEKLINHNYNYEVICFGIIIYLIKTFYGLNHLPYAISVYKNVQFYMNSNDEINKLLNLFDTHGQKDHLYPIYNQLPNFLDIVQRLKSLISLDEKDYSLWEPLDLKKSLSKNYKDNFIKHNQHLFSNVENSYTNNRIIALENEFNISFQHSEVLQHKSPKVKFSEKFEKKRMKKQSTRINSFLCEEIEFYENLNSKISGKKYKIPLPCDTFVRFNKQAMKFEGVTPPLSELVIFYYFSKYFKVDFKILKKAYKIIECAVENNLKQHK